MSEDERGAVRRAVEQLDELARDVERESTPDRDAADLIAFDARIAEQVRQIAESLHQLLE